MLLKSHPFGCRTEGKPERYGRCNKAIADLRTGMQDILAKETRRKREMPVMTAKNYLEYIVREIHTTIVATVDDEGLPVTAAIDMMAAD